MFCRPIGNNQWHIVAHLKSQPDGTMSIVPTNNQIVQQISQSEQSQTQQKLLQSKQIQAVAQPQKLVIQAHSTNNQQNQASTSTIEKSLLQGQPPGTIIKCVTAEVTKNQNGPCIKLTGIQGSELTEHQMSLVHQQVKQQLVKKGNY